MKRGVTLAFAGILLLTVSACAPAAMNNQATNSDSAMTEKSTESEMAMDESQAMTETMAMDDSHAMTETEMMDDSHTMSETESMTDTAMTGESMGDEGKMAEAEAMMELPAWMTLPLTNARTGETMTLADLKGKTVFVETMATWCPNCRTQLGNVKAAAAANSNPDVVFVAISVETDLAPEQLAQYADSNGFDWFFAVSSPELLVELVNAFGQTIANPPATPHFVIKADGTVGQLVTGFENSDQILAGLQ